MSALAIVLVVVGGLVLLLLLGGIAGARRRERAFARRYGERVHAADRALEHARATDKGWDRAELERIARAALAEQRPGERHETLVLVLVDDPPGVEHDRAHFVASGDRGDTRVILARTPSGWLAERVE